MGCGPPGPRVVDVVFGFMYLCCLDWDVNALVFGVGFAFGESQGFEGITVDAFGNIGYGFILLMYYPLCHHLSSHHKVLDQSRYQYT